MLFKVASHDNSGPVFQNGQLLKTVDIQVTKFPNGNIQSHIFKDDAGNIFHYMYNIDGQMVSASQRNPGNVLLWTSFQTYYANKNLKSAIITYTKDFPNPYVARTGVEQYFRSDGTPQSVKRTLTDGSTVLSEFDTKGRYTTIKYFDPSGTLRSTVTHTYYGDTRFVNTVTTVNADGSGSSVQWASNGVEVIAMTNTDSNGNVHVLVKQPDGGWA